MWDEVQFQSPALPDRDSGDRHRLLRWSSVEPVKEATAPTPAMNLHQRQGFRNADLTLDDVRIPKTYTKYDDHQICYCRQAVNSTIWGGT